MWRHSHQAQNSHSHTRTFPSLTLAPRTSFSQVDMWSLGVILYILLSGRHPFDAPGRSDAQMRRAIQTSEVSFEHSCFSEVSDEAKQLIRSLLRHDPSHRLNPPALLNHPWVVGTNVSAVPITGSDQNLKQYQRMRRKWSTALVVSMHKQAAIKKRFSERDRKRDQIGRHASDENGQGVAAAELGDKGGSGSGTDLEVRELLEDAFKEFDPEGKGYVLETDLAGIIKRLGQQVTPDELQQMISALEGGSGRTPPGTPPQRIPSGIRRLRASVRSITR